LDLSVERRLWATQRHNEEILDQAYRTSKEVYLIFGVNKSGEFYGYARMAGPVRRGEQRISWASRSSQSPTSRSSHSPLSVRSTKAGETFFSPSDLRLVDSSPLPVDSHSTYEGPIRHSAPALLGEQYHLPTLITPAGKFSLDQHMAKSAGQDGFELDPSAPQRAMRQPPSSRTSAQDKASGRPAPALQPVEEVEESRPGEAIRQPQESKGEEAWGDSFPVEWVTTERLPFHRTRHLRNPWNHDREVKVSRDGTELEPTVGERLIQEWEKLAKEPQAQGPLATGPIRPASKRTAGPKSAGLTDGVEDTAHSVLDGGSKVESSRS
jgi:hypothetical protein